MSRTKSFSPEITAADRLDLIEYPSEPPFHPEMCYLEYKFGETGPTTPLYGAVRGLFHLLGLDAPRYRISAWVPMGDIVRQGDSAIY